MSRIIPEPAFRSIRDMVGTDTLVPANDFAAIAGLHRATMRKLMARGELAYVQITARRKVIPTKHLTAEIAGNIAAFADGIRAFRTSQVVYFIGAGAAGPIKIGIACDIERRLFELQQAHYEELLILGTTAGGLQLERDLHRRFASNRIRGEWFERTPALLAEIERLKEMG